MFLARDVGLHEKPCQAFLVTATGGLTWVKYKYDQY